MSRIAELEAEIAAEEHLAAAAEREAARAAQAAAAEMRRAETELGKAVAALEKTVTRQLAAAAEVAAGTPVPSLHERLMARRLLLGTLLQAPQDTGGPVGVVTREDGAAGLLWTALDGAQRVRRDAEEQLDPGHPLTARADVCECSLWRAFQARLRQVAGEDG